MIKERLYYNILFYLCYKLILRENKQTNGCFLFGELRHYQFMNATYFNPFRFSSNRLFNILNHIIKGRDQIENLFMYQFVYYC